MLTENQILRYIQNSLVTSNNAPLFLTECKSRALQFSDQKPPEKTLLGVYLCSPQDYAIPHEFRTTPNINRKRLNENLEETDIDPVLAIDLFELDKFISLWVKGSPIIYPMLIGPKYIHNSLELRHSLMKLCLTNKVGKIVLDSAISEWQRNKNDFRKVAKSAYRLIQVHKYLVTKQWIEDYDSILTYSKVICVPNLTKILNTYNLVIKDHSTDVTLWSLFQETDVIIKDFIWLEQEIKKAMIFTTLPDRIPKDCFNSIIENVKEVRLSSFRKSSI